VFANLIFAKLALILQCLPSSETKTASEYQIADNGNGLHAVGKV
jgi:hypothetical protein